jgi:hypothetical protein
MLLSINESQIAALGQVKRQSRARSDLRRCSLGDRQFIDKAVRARVAYSAQGAMAAVPKSGSAADIPELPP